MTDDEEYTEELRAVFAEMTPLFESEFSFQQIAYARSVARERVDARADNNGEGAK